MITDMKTKHTTGEWRVEEEEAPHQVWAGSSIIAYCDEDSSVAVEESIANAARIVACINYLEGVPTKELLQHTQDKR